MAGADRTGALSVALDANPSEAALDEAIDVLQKAQPRLIVAEFPAVPSNEILERRLRARGFTDEAEITDYYADGTAMRILSIRQTAPADQAKS